jgi:hypothetical protein
MFAKVGAMHMLGAFFGQGCMVMTPAIHKDEVRVLLERIKEADALEVPPEVEMEIFGDSENNEQGSPQ